MRRERPRPRTQDPLAGRRTKARRVLVVGIGNPGRGDDGLGAAAVARLERRRLPGVTCDANYQLAIEDALACAESDAVVFVDAARGLRVPFRWSEVRPEAAAPALSHALGPGAVLGLCAALYDRTPVARLLAIRGHRWGVGEGLSPRAAANLGRAVRSLAGYVRRATAGKEPRP